jgi:hypothetical protein
MNTHHRTEPDDARWLAHLRDLSTGIEPPTSADPHAMSRAAIRRTRTRRAFLATGGGVTAVAAVAATAFALGSPTTPGVLLPGGLASASASADASTSVEERRARALEEQRMEDVREAAIAALESAGVPDGWEVHELEGLTYALPPEIETSGPVQDEPGVTSDMWHSGADPDAPPFLRMAYVTPDYAFYDTEADGLTQTPGPGATSFELAGASVASIEVRTPELRAIAGTPAGSEVEPVRILVHREDGPGRYVITMTLSGGPEFGEDFVEEFRSSLQLN